MEQGCGCCSIVSSGGGVAGRPRRLERLEQCETGIRGLFHYFIGGEAVGGERRSGERHPAGHGGFLLANSGQRSYHEFGWTGKGWVKNRKTASIAFDFFFRFGSGVGVFENLTRNGFKIREMSKMLNPDDARYASSWFR
ncbi:hypothetical protein [Azospirillum sp. B2RO_4]|uniref:hypothetical protein n=1 Tax=Azospirillum sp. B2RO_4 TaxID=3027796 RepID=UPI003DA89324